MSTRESSTNKVTIILFCYVLPGFCEYKGKQYKQGDNNIILICFARFL